MEVLPFLKFAATVLALAAGSFQMFFYKDFPPRQHAIFESLNLNTDYICI